MKIPASKFKAECLKIMDNVKIYHHEVIITKHGKPVVKIVPIKSIKGEKPKSIFGYMKGSGIATGDIISPLKIKWISEK